MGDLKIGIWYDTGEVDVPPFVYCVIDSDGEILSGYRTSNELGSDVFYFGDWVYYGEYYGWGLSGDFSIARRMYIPQSIELRSVDRLIACTVPA